MKIFILGGCGFLGSNIADEMAACGNVVTVFDNLSRLGAVENLKWLKSRHRLDFVHGDVRKSDDIEAAVQDFNPDVILNFAGQVAMTTSIKSPRLDFEINALGTFNVLEAARQFAPEAQVLFSSTNKVYGDLEWVDYTEAPTRFEANGFEQGFDEKIPLDFSSPYGCSKGAAEQYVLDYNRIYGLKTAVFRHSSMYGGRQFATADQGWIGWFCGQYADPDVSEISISGNGKQVRDLLHADDMRSLYRQAIYKADDIAGQCFNVGGGMANSMSLLELFTMLSGMTGRNTPIVCNPPRQSDQKVFVADITKVTEALNWAPKVDAKSGIQSMLDWARSIREDSVRSGESAHV